MTVIELLRDLLARVVFLREEFDPYVRDAALEGLEEDLAAAVAAEERLAAA